MSKRIPATLIPGDGIGPDVWRASQRVMDAAVAKAYGGKRKIAWMEVYAGEKANDVYGENTWLPKETLEACKEYLVSIKGPLTTPVGGGIRSVEAARIWLDAGASSVVLGTAAQPEILRQLPRARLIAALDAQCEVWVITQNVDGLHTAAGSRRVVALHGRLDRVVCLTCGDTSTRASLADRLARANSAWRAKATQVNPDGDMEVADEVLDDFVVVDCERCAGTLMPDVVYFGGSVPAPRVAEAFDLVDAASLLLVLGSSLTVFSGRRFVVHAARAGIAVAIVNEGRLGTIREVQAAIGGAPTSPSIPVATPPKPERSARQPDLTRWCPGP